VVYRRDGDTAGDVKATFLLGEMNEYYCDKKA